MKHLVFNVSRTNIQNVKIKEPDIENHACKIELILKLTYTTQYIHKVRKEIIINCKKLRGL
jgi:hypothetical protein